MKTRILVCLLSLLVVAAMTVGPVSGTNSQPTVQLSEIDVVVGSSAPGAFSDSQHEAKCGGLAPLEPCTDSIFLPEVVEGLFLGAAVDPYFTGWLVITLTTDPFFIEVTCEIIAGGVVAAACVQSGGQGVLLGAEMVLDVDFNPTAIGQYEISVWYE